MDMYQALADPNRRRIIELIALKGQLTSTDIADKFDISAPAISQHLKILREAKLVDMEKHAQQRIYTLNRESFDDIQKWINKMQELWEERFQKLDKILEDLKKKSA